MEFQFHKGTIRTMVRMAILSSVPAFQFHKGTIRTGLLREIQASQSYFNSIKVRLEPQKQGQNEKQVPRFQFHKGTIRTYLHYDL